MIGGYEIIVSFSASFIELFLAILFIGISILMGLGICHLLSRLVDRLEKKKKVKKSSLLRVMNMKKEGDKLVINLSDTKGKFYSGRIKIKKEECENIHTPLSSGLPGGQ